MTIEFVDGFDSYSASEGDAEKIRRYKFPNVAAKALEDHKYRQRKVPSKKVYDRKRRDD